VSIGDLPGSASGKENVMSHSIVRRLVAVLSLSALLGSPATSLAASRSSARHSRPQTAQHSLTWLWNALVGGWEKEGCHVDPYGHCITVGRPMNEGCSVGSDPGCLDSSRNNFDKKM